ncbi:MAG: UPF0280 family protein [Desulfobacterales bacterium]|nr:MAG: UPF0280 family protein [Desulfobacterales bacterium]UCD89013.1 MAG: UPF0280 family protein [Desulfobacterales bacterium]
MHQIRSYRNLLYKGELIAFRVVVKETDIFVHATKPLENITKEIILKHRGYIEAYIRRYPAFVTALAPWRLAGPLPAIIREMVGAGENAGVGPMAAVAGAIAEQVGLDLLAHTDEVIVENGGDVFLKTHMPVTVGIFAGSSPISLRMGLRLDSEENPVSVCTSSGTVGHSLSFGKADAVCVISRSCALADAAATSIGNKVDSKGHIQQAIDFGKHIKGVMGIVVIVEDAVGAWGEVEMVPLEREKG